MQRSDRARASTASWLTLLVGGYAFALQIHADFSGDTDIARGSARLLGIELMENFAALGRGRLTAAVAAELERLNARQESRATETAGTGGEAHDRAELDVSSGR